MKTSPIESALSQRNTQMQRLFENKFTLRRNATHHELIDVMSYFQKGNQIARTNSHSFHT